LGRDLKLETLVKLFEDYKIGTPAELVVKGHCQSISRMIKTSDEVMAQKHIWLEQA
jgi:hypothetical protein